MLRAGDDEETVRVTDDGTDRGPAERLGRGPDEDDGRPGGEVYDWFVRGRSLLDGGNPEAAAQLLTRAREHEPASASVLEALARALFDARRYREAEQRFAELVDARPDDDYARFGLGLSRLRQGDLAGAVQQLAMAATMRPGRPDYQQALREARATVQARADAGLDPDRVDPRETGPHGRGLPGEGPA